MTTRISNKNIKATNKTEECMHVSLETTLILTLKAKILIKSREKWSIYNKNKRKIVLC